MAFLSKIKTFLISPKTIVSLIVITLIACAIGFFVPQAADKSPSFFETWQEKNIYTYRFVTRLQLHRVYTSYWFLTLVLLLQASLLTSLYQQIKVHIRKIPPLKKADIGGFNDRSSKRILKIIKKRGYHFSSANALSEDLENPPSPPFDKGGNTFSGNTIFTKNNIGRWGGIIFHIGLLLIIISALLVVCFQKRGFFQLVEGEKFDGKESSLLVLEKGPFADKFNIGYETYLSGFMHEYWPDNKTKFLESELSIIKGNDAINKSLSVNNPLRFYNTNIYQSFDYGYTLSFTLKKSNGEEIISQFNMDRASDVSSYTMGRSGFPLSSYILGLKFIPDLDKKSFYLNKPIVYLTVDEGLNRVFKGLVVPGTAVNIKNDILYFTGVRYWSGLIFTSIPGVLLAYIGFAVSILGTAIMFLLPYKEIHVNFDSNKISDIKGITRRYQALFKEEVEEIKRELETMSNE